MFSCSGTAQRATALALVALATIIVSAVDPVAAQTATDTPTPTVAPTPIFVGGGGGPASDCLAVFYGIINDSALKPKNIRCTDGDSRCDADGVVNGVCAFPLTVCANSTFNSTKCTLAGVQTMTVDHAADNGDPKFDTDFQALQSRSTGCTRRTGRRGTPSTTPSAAAPRAISARSRRWSTVKSTLPPPPTFTRDFSR